MKPDVFNVFALPQLVNITDNYMTLMSDNGDIREDLRVPDSDVGKEIESKFEAGDDFLVSGVLGHTPNTSTLPFLPFPV